MSQLFVGRRAAHIAIACMPVLFCISLFAVCSLAAATPAEARSEDATGYMNQRFVQPSWVKAAPDGRQRPAKIGKYLRARNTAAKRKSSNGLKVAALGKEAFQVPQPKTPVTGSGVRWVAAATCLNNSLTTVIYQIANAFGPVTVNSTCRSRGHNARVGGARRSQHLTGDAVDFRVPGGAREVYAFLRASGLVGGLKHYGGGLFHIDSGARRSW